MNMFFPNSTGNSIGIYCKFRGLSGKNYIDVCITKLQVKNQKYT